MSNLEHLLENGLYNVTKLNPEKWKEYMKKDSNWNSNIHMTLEELWIICQYVEYCYPKN